jgi:hypothetical protein
MTAVTGGAYSLHMGRTLIAVVLAAVGCGGSSTSDAGADGSGACATDCSDGLFCNGVEQCIDGACVAGDPPCAATSCDEESDSCACEDADADGDGVHAIACGGPDCDDDDPLRYPGNTEICDAENHDEDCDHETFGETDADGDGHVDAECCNVESDGTPHCGDDCDDGNRFANPDLPEDCDAVDNDCDGVVNEGVTTICYVDADSDGYPAEGATSTEVCGFCPPATTVLDPALGMIDCDETRSEVNPGRTTDTCDMDLRDDDCDGTGNDGCACIDGAQRSCCDGRGSEVCVGGMYGNCSALAVETCNHIDDDCDGRTDELTGPGPCYWTRRETTSGADGPQFATGWMCAAGENAASVTTCPSMYQTDRIRLTDGSGVSAGAVFPEIPPFDLSGYVLVFARFRVLAGEHPNRGVAVVLTTARRAGPGGQAGIYHGASATERGYAARVRFASRVLDLYYFEGGSASAAIASIALPSACIPTPAHGETSYTVVLRGEMGRFTATLTAGSLVGCDLTVSGTDPQFLEHAYSPQGSTYPRFSPGATAGESGGGILTTSVVRFDLQRSDLGGNAPPCVACSEPACTACP